MFVLIQIVLVTVLLYPLCHGDILPVQMPQCHVTDTTCLNNAATRCFRILKEPNKALKLPSIDPYVIKFIQISANQNSRVSFDQVYNDMKFVGMSTGVVNNFKVHLNQTHVKLKFDLYMDEFNMISWYQWNGTVMSYPIDGYGFCNITSIDVTHTHELLLAIGKNKKLKLRNYKVDLRPIKIVFDLDDLVRDNPDASARALKLFNEYSTPIFNAVKQSYDRIFAKCFFPYACRFFKHVKLNNLFKGF